MPAFSEYRVFAVGGIPEVGPGDDLAAVIDAALLAQETPLETGDVLCITQKIISKAEHRVIVLADVEPGAMAIQWAEQWEKDARAVELVLRECRRIVRMERGIIIAETQHGWICANAGVDASNIGGGDAVYAVRNFYRFEKPTAAGGHLVLPHGSGYLIPADCPDTLPGRGEVGGFIGARWTLPLFGLVRDDTTLCAIAENW